MLAYIIRRILLSIIVLFGVTLLIFSIVHFIPGDPAVAILGELATSESIAELTELMGFNDPLPTQYIRYIKKALVGDFGRSFKSNRPVIDEISRRLWPTVQLAFLGIGFAFILGVIGGTIAAFKKDTGIDYLTMIFATLGISLPSFVLGIFIILLFSLKLGWLPTGGYGTFRHFIAPVVSLGLTCFAIMARLARSSIIETLGMDYIRTARAKGLPEKVVLYKHTLRNSLIPIVTIAGLYLGWTLGGTVIIETLFSWPGLGRLALEAVYARDYPLMQGIVLLMATVFVLINLLVDLSYAFLDPRISYE
jgi:ABC-type dipeptide/oligopeptide/nickel transport system permease component